MTDDIDVGQGRLGFVGAVLKHFAFLTSAGFKVDALKPTLVTFSSSDCSINIYFGRSSYELGFVLQRAGQEFQLVEFIHLTDPLQAKAYQNFQASTAESVAKGVASLAKLVSQFAAPVFKADPSIFERLAQNQNERSKEYELEVLAGQVRPLADAAFRNKDYDATWELYGKFLPALSNSEIARYTLAGRRKAKS